MLSNAPHVSEADAANVARPALEQLQDYRQGFECLKVSSRGRGKAAPRILQIDSTSSFLFYTPSSKDLMQLLFPFSEMMSLSRIPVPKHLAAEWPDYEPQAAELQTVDRKLVLMFKKGELHRFVMAVALRMQETRPHDDESIDALADKISSIWAEEASSKNRAAIERPALAAIFASVGKTFNDDGELTLFVQGVLDRAKCPLARVESEPLNWAVDYIQFSHVFHALAESKVLEPLFEQLSGSRAQEGGELLPEKLEQFFSSIQCERVRESIVLKMVNQYARTSRAEPYLTFAEFCSFAVDSKCNSWQASRVDKALQTALPPSISDCFISSVDLAQVPNKDPFPQIGTMLRHGVRLFKMQFLFVADNPSTDVRNASIDTASGRFGVANLLVSRSGVDRDKFEDVASDIEVAITSKMLPIILSIEAAEGCSLSDLQRFFKVLKLMSIEDVLDKAPRELRGKVLIHLQKPRIRHRATFLQSIQTVRGGVVGNRPRAGTGTLGLNATQRSTAPTLDSDWLEKKMLFVFDQTWNRHLALTSALFAANTGNTGYIPARVEKASTLKLNVRVLFGFMIPSVGGHFVVEVGTEEIVPAAGSPTKGNTYGSSHIEVKQGSSQRTTGHAFVACQPTWNELLAGIDVPNKISSIIVVRVIDVKNPSQEAIVAEGVVSVRSLRLGLRAVPLVGSKGQDVSPATICCHFSLSSRKENHEPNDAASNANASGTMSGSSASLKSPPAIANP